MITMRLQPEIYDSFINGTKRFEIRLLDEKRKQLKVGDIIKIMKRPDYSETFDAKVEELLLFNNFNEVFDSIDNSLLFNEPYTRESLLEELNKFYPPEEQEELGVVGIRLSICKDKC